MSDSTIVRPTTPFRERTPEIVRARELRSNPTPAELRLWSALRKKQLRGLKFRRQAPLGSYIADFVCLSARLIVELDGAQHSEPGRLQYDERRTLWLKGQSFRVIRFRNEDVLRELDVVLTTIAYECGGA